VIRQTSALSGLRLHAHASNVRVNQHKSEVMTLNESVFCTSYNMMRSSQSACYIGLFFKDGAVDVRLQYEASVSDIKQRVDS
jgi:hypothetical protein